MKTMLNLFVAGAMTASAGWAGSTDQFAQEFLKSKLGRYAPSEEARRQALPKAEVHAVGCNMPNCHHQHAAAKVSPQTSVAAGESQAETWLRSKLGRELPRPKAESQAVVLAAAEQPKAVCCN